MAPFAATLVVYSAHGGVVVVVVEVEVEVEVEVVVLLLAADAAEDEAAAAGAGALPFTTAGDANVEDFAALVLAGCTAAGLEGFGAGDLLPGGASFDFFLSPKIDLILSKGLIPQNKLKWVV
jgi:hypothetical protein